MRIENTFGIEAEALAVIKYDSEKGLTNALKRLHKFNAELPILLIGQGSNLLFLSDFLSFYARFCSDSIFQSQSIADPLHISLQDSEDEDEIINGIIDADQWQTFCPEVPSGIISNIRKGQTYGGHRIVMRKSGLSNGLQEIFTFNKERTGWRLTRYEN